MTRYYLYIQRDDIKPGWREYLWPAWQQGEEPTGMFVEMPGTFDAMEFTPAEAAMLVLQGYQEELVG